MGVSECGMDWCGGVVASPLVVHGRGDKLIVCAFSQRQGCITISRSGGVVHELAPPGDRPGNHADQGGRRVYREVSFVDAGQILRFPREGVHVYWNSTSPEPANEGNPTRPFTGAPYDATGLFRGKGAWNSKFSSCPGGNLRREDREALIVVRNKLDARFASNLLKHHVDATNRGLQARLDGGTWILQCSNGDVWEMPIAAIEGD